MTLYWGAARWKHVSYSITYRLIWALFSSQMRHDIFVNIYNAVNTSSCRNTWLISWRPLAMMALMQCRNNNHTRRRDTSGSMIAFWRRCYDFKSFTIFAEPLWGPRAMSRLWLRRRAHFGAEECKTLLARNIDTTPHQLAFLLNSRRHFISVLFNEIANRQ